MKVLHGVKVLVTRPREQAAGLVRELDEQGATAILMPVIEIVPVAPDSPLDQALRWIGTYDWVVFTSVNGVAAAAKRIDSIPGNVKIAAIGPATAAACADNFRKPDVVPDEYLSEAIAPALGDVRGKKILLARADIARNELAVDLKYRGAIVDEVAAYHIRPVENPEPPKERPDFISATSSSAVRSTVICLNSLNLGNWVEEIPWICIGPVTEATARELNCKVAATAGEYTSGGLVQALIDYVRKEKVNA